MLQFLAAILPGHYNTGGTVSAATYTVWRDNLGAPAGTLPNDTDGGPIGSAQYATWKANFGMTQGTGIGQTSQAIPEPASGFLLLMGILLAQRFRMTSVLSRTR